MIDFESMEKVSPTDKAWPFESGAGERVKEQRHPDMPRKVFD